MLLPPSPPVFSHMQMVQAQQDVQHYQRSLGGKAMSLSSSSYMGDHLQNRRSSGLVDFRSIQQQQRESRITPPTLHSFREDDEMGIADEGAEFGRSLTSRNIPAAVGARGRSMSNNQGLSLGTSPTVFSLLATSSDAHRSSLLGSSLNSQAGASGTRQHQPSSRSVFSSISTSATGQGSPLDSIKDEGKADDSFNQEEDMMFALSLGHDETNSFLREEDPPQAGMEALYIFD